MDETMKMSWKTSEFYQEYLELKTEIAELAQKVELADSMFFDGSTFLVPKSRPTRKFVWMKSWNA